MLSSLLIKDFTVFSEAELEFGGLNVFHGENSTGKTHLLKLIYSITSSLIPALNQVSPPQPTKTALEKTLPEKLSSIFRPDGMKVGRIARRKQGRSSAEVKAEFDDIGRLSFSFSSQHDRSVKIETTPQSWLNTAPVFLPTRELLSVYPGFVSLYATQAVPFDATWRDTCELLGAPVSRGAKKREIAALLSPLEEAIGCKALLEGDRFFLQMKIPSAKIEADMVAEGLRKLSMVARLIANGSLDEKACLVWDEPEANLNPSLIRKIAPMLLTMAEGGVQIFIATHSLFLMRELAIVQPSHPQVQTRYFGLHLNSGEVRIEQGPTIDDSGDIAALDESISQSERYLDMEDQ